MGKGYIYTCKKCGKEYRFLLDCGMFCFMEDQLFDLENPIGGILANCHDEEEKGIVKRLIESRKYHLVGGYGYKICKCNGCGQFDNKFTFELFSREEKNSYISKAICEKCNKELRILNDEDLEKENIPGNCDKCGSTEFDIGFMNWD